MSLYITTKSGKTISGEIVSIGKLSVEIRGRVVFQDNEDRTYYVALSQVASVDMLVPEDDLCDLCLEFLGRL